VSYGGPVIDAGVFHEWPDTPTLTGYMDEAWQELLLRPGDRSGPVNLRGGKLFVDPRGAKAVAHGAMSSSEKAGLPGSDYDEMRATVLERSGRERVVLGYDRGLSCTTFPHPYVAREIVRAANDWTVAEWLDRGDDVHGMVLVSTLLPDEAAAEIRRVGTHPKMVAVALGCNALARPFGDPVYLPVFEAAAELDLPLVVQLGSDAATDLLSNPVGGGAPITYAEYLALGAQSQMAQASSMILMGIFARFPNLKLFLLGGGATWVPQWLWRLDSGYKGRAHMVPWLDRPPSAYFMDHVRVSTLGLERPENPALVGRALGVIDGIERTLVYAGGAFSNVAEEPGEIAARLPEAWHQAVFHDNALDLFRWPGTTDDRRHAVPASTTIGG